MAARGNPPTPAPGRTLTSLLLAEPAISPDLRLAPWFSQFLIRLSSYVGPADGTSTTISTSVTNVTQGLIRTLGASGADPAAQERLQALEAAVARMGLPLLGDGAGGLPAPLAPAADPGRGVPPLAPLAPWLTEEAVTTATAIYAPLVNGDLPGPTLIADPYGQTIMVPIT